MEKLRMLSMGDVVIEDAISGAAWSVISGRTRRTAFWNGKLERRR
jgi:hypothetical protein